LRDKKNRVERRPAGVPLIRAAALAPALAFLGRVGAPVERLVERANLRPDDLQEPEAHVPIVFANRLIDSAARATGIPDFGLVVTRDVNPFSLGDYGRRMAHSGTVGRAIEISQELKPAWNSGEHVWLTRRRGEIELHHRFVVARHDSWNQSVAVGLMLHLNLLMGVTGGRWRPRHLRLPVPASPVYREAPILADAQIDFDAPWTTITFPASLFALPLPRPTAPMPIMVRPFEAPSQEWTASVRSLVTLLLRTGYPSIALVADAAGTTVRTLQRRLGEKGITYQQIVSEVRLAKGARSLVESNRKIIDVALELGYSDPAHFTRAFRAGTGMTPFAFRRMYRHRELAPAQSPLANTPSRTA
jgi:AraC-like DNA-binding protein